MTVVKFYDPRQGMFAPLSNLHPRTLQLDGVVYASPEHAYQAAKARDAKLRDWLMRAPTPELAAVVGDALPSDQIVAGWDDTHVTVMERIVQAKFLQQSDLRLLLLSTGDAKIVESSPQDGPIARFWGEFEGQGLNTLGRMLMRVRDELRKASGGSPSPVPYVRR